MVELTTTLLSLFSGPSGEQIAVAASLSYARGVHTPMISGTNEAVSEAGVGWLKYAVAAKLGWIFREQPSQDKGVDAQVEEVLNGSATGRLIGLQIKAGSSWFKRKTRSGYVYTGDPEHLTYWQGHSLPILIVLFNPNASEAYWQLVSDSFVKRTRRSTSLLPGWR